MSARFLSRAALVGLLVLAALAGGPVVLAGDLPALERQVLQVTARPGVPLLNCPPRPVRAAGRPAVAPAPLPPPLVLPLTEEVTDPGVLPPLPLRLEDGGGARPVRIAVWGDSHVAGGSFVESLITAIRGRGLAVARASIPVGLTQPGIALPIRRGCAPQGEWKLQPAYRADQTVAVGPSLVSLRAAGPGSRLWLDLRDRDGGGPRYRGLAMRYTPHAQGARVAVVVDDGEPQEVALSGAPDGTPRLAELTLAGDGPLSTLRLEVLSGSFELQALWLPLPEPEAVLLDAYGLNSATAAGWVRADPDVLREVMSDRGYDVVVAAYGTNEGAAPTFDRHEYAAALRASVKAWRSVFPRQPCVLVGPPDRGARPVRGRRGDPLLYARRHREIAQVQAMVAPEFGCTFWDWQAAMGGEGSSLRWARAVPPLMSADLTHLTAAGYQRSGAVLARALSLGAEGSDPAPRAELPTAGQPVAVRAERPRPPVRPVSRKRSDAARNLRKRATERRIREYLRAPSR